MTTQQLSILRRTWRSMISRCKPTDVAHKRYYDRGIRVCKAWMNFDVFVSDMGPRPEKMSLDRIDNNKGYSAKNCRWATQKQQMRNTERSLYVNFRGRSRLLAEVAEEQGVSLQMLHNRYSSGWKIEVAIVEPVNTKNRIVRRWDLDPRADQIMFRSISGRDLIQ